MIKKHFLKIIALLFLAMSSTAHAEKIIWKEITIPMQEAGQQGLETLLVWPDSAGKHPLALISHGSPRDPKQRPLMSAMSSLPIAMEFARRGFAVAVVMRRGYGHSGGTWVEGYHSCQAANYPAAAAESVKDLRAAIQYLSTLPQVDTDHMIAVGVSAGGFASLALSAATPPPKGLLAVINFAGGRGSMASDSICQLDSLVATFGDFGKQSRVPTLWVYATNDHFMNPLAAKKFLNAFKSNGGNATFIAAAPYGTEGHFLFSNAGIPQWTPLVDDFLTQQHLAIVDNLLPLPETTKLKAPTQLSKKNQAAFATYLSNPPHKAFAVDPSGAYGWSSGKYSTDEAISHALDSCNQYSKTECKVYAVDGNLSSRAQRGISK